MMAFCCTETELALKKRFEGVYERTRAPIMRAIERQVCGCDYGGNSWTSKDQADALIRLLELGPDSDLIDLGAGTGWPGIYIAKTCGCSVTLVDLPEIGLQIALRRADVESREQLAQLLGAEDAKLRLAKWRSKFQAIEDGLFVRELFVCQPI